jgi:hypothetical protein
MILSLVLVPVPRFSCPWLLLPLDYIVLSYSTHVFRSYSPTPPVLATSLLMSLRCCYYCCSSRNTETDSYAKK